MNTDDDILSYEEVHIKRLSQESPEKLGAYVARAKRLGGGVAKVHAIGFEIDSGDLIGFWEYLPFSSKKQLAWYPVGHVERLDEKTPLGAFSTVSHSTAAVDENKP